MKNIFRIFSICLVFLALLVFYRTLGNSQNISEETQKEEVLGEVIDNNNYIDIGEYRLAWFEALSEQVILIPNFTDKKITSDWVEGSECKRAINAGFYNEDNKPIGLFINNAEVINEYRPNNLFNGVFSINKLEIPRITREVPKDELDIAIQSGPMIMESDEFIEYSASTDKNARRMLAMVTGENKLIFASVYDKNSVFNGPRLSELAGILAIFEERIGLNIADVINLDGGSASAFYSDSIRLSEISPVGSLFCIK